MLCLQGPSNSGMPCNHCLLGAASQHQQCRHCNSLGVGDATSDALPVAGGQVNHNIDHANENEVCTTRSYLVLFGMVDVLIHLPSCSTQCIRKGRLV